MLSTIMDIYTDLLIEYGFIVDFFYAKLYWILIEWLYVVFNEIEWLFLIFLPKFLFDIIYITLKAQYIKKSAYNPNFS